MARAKSTPSKFEYLAPHKGPLRIRGVRYDAHKWTEEEARENIKKEKALESYFNFPGKEAN